jgi:hypothetical protein
MRIIREEKNMRFDNDYWHALDKQTAERINVSPKYIGRSTPPMADQVESLKGRIFQGATHVELGFWGSGKGSKQQGATTPEMYGKEQREALRQMAKINDITLSVHSTPNAGPLSGMNYEQGGFSKETQERSLDEVRRAVDFAAEVVRGGPVVVHLQGEFPKPISERKGFEAYDGEAKESPVYFVNKETGRIESLRRDMRVSVVDEEKTKEAGELRFKRKEFGEFVDEFNRLSEDEKRKYSNNPGKYFYSNFMMKDIEALEGESERFHHHAQQAERKLREIEEMKEKYSDFVGGRYNKEAAKKEYVNWLVAKGIVPDEKYSHPEEYKKIVENPVSYLNSHIKEIERERRYYEETAIGQGKKADSYKSDIENLKPLEEVGLEKSATGVAEAAIYAYKKEKKMDLENPLFIAPENIFPEMGYGGHPDELKEVVLKSREIMARKLNEKEGVPMEQAERIAKEHIKATFDIGHANTWKKFFNGNDEDFNKWLKTKVKELNEKEIIGHVHLSDNFGYYDEELPVGEGTAPVKEFVKQMREEGYKGKMVVESPEDKALYPAWRTLSSPIYRINGATSTWTEIEGSYFGRTARPVYVFGEGVEPSEDWRNWSGASLE